MSAGLLSRITGLIDRINNHEARLVKLERAPWMASIGTIAGGTFTSTPGAFGSLVIPHGLGIPPAIFLVQPANANARAAPAYHVTADNTNITLNFATNLTAATSYSWNWFAK